MAIRATSGFGIVRYEPGNPEFPTLPDGVQVPHLITYGGGAGLASRAPIKTGRVLGAAPAGEEQQFAGWQTDTTWISPATVDFGVIPSPVQKTVSLYNTRSTPVTVTALSLPSGVTLISPSLPITLLPFGGATFTLEAGVTGDNTFDEFSTFTTSEGDATFRIIGRRVFNLENIPETPVVESVFWKTDLIRSTDGTEKAYSLGQSPTSQVDYKIKFRNDVDRIKFRNNFIASESALVVSGQKWYEARRLLNAAQSADTTLDVDVNVIDASWVAGGPIAVVTEDGSAYSAQLSSFQFQPDPDYASNVLVLRFDGANGATTDTDLSPLSRAITFGSQPAINTSQSVFGGSSVRMNGNGVVAEGISAAYDPAVEFGSGDFTIDMWIYPANLDMTATPMLISRWDSFADRSWYLNLRADRIRFETWSPSNTYDFVFGSPREVNANQWHYIRLCRSGNDLRCFVDGVQIGSTANITHAINSYSGSPELVTKIGAYYDSGFTFGFEGYIDDVRVTAGVARSVVDFTPPTEPHAVLEDTYLELTLGSEFGADVPANSFVMPSSLGYVSSFPSYRTHRKNLEEADYSLTFNQESDLSNLDTTYFQTLTDLQSPESTLPILEFCNEIRGTTKSGSLQKFEDVLDSGITNRIAFSEFPYGDDTSEFRITLDNPQDVWSWRTFFHYLRGSYGQFYVPTFTNDIPNVTTAATNTFTAPDTDLALLFGNPPDPRRNAIRLKYPDGTIQYRFITAVVDNGATEDITVNLAVNAGSPEISYLQRCRILGDTVTFDHRRIDDVTLTFRFRTILL